MWLQVTQVLEICDCWGGNILLEQWEGKTQTHIGCCWLITVKPESTNWKEWQRALMSTFALDKYCGLKEILGK